MVSRIGDNSSRRNPVSVSDKINTTGDEMSVFIHPDDQDPFFIDGHPHGRTSTFFIGKNSLGEWGEPVNLGYPINTRGMKTLFVSPNGEPRFLFQIVRRGKGQLDYISLFLLPEGWPQPV